MGVTLRLVKRNHYILKLQFVSPPLSVKLLSNIISSGFITITVFEGFRCFIPQKKSSRTDKLKWNDRTSNFVQFSLTSFKSNSGSYESVIAKSFSTFFLCDSSSPKNLGKKWTILLSSCYTINRNTYFWTGQT